MDGRDDRGEPFTTSLVIAERTGNEHHSTMRLINENLADLNEVGLCRFEMINKVSTSGNALIGRPSKHAQLDEAAATLLMTYLRNTPVVKEFKKQLVIAF